ncbi:SGNH/GDSL hydrolase family protein [Rhodobacteraceae bacterium D3-12]|nr:SGNH/GDSL hydrolase family protein [Rhodobacteraceae bacterium D3-12]
MNLLKILCFFLLSGALHPMGALADTGKNGARILVIGDSLIASHSVSGRGIADRLEQILRQPIDDNSVAGARMIYNLPITGAMGLSIPKQYRDGNWDWVIVNGGGNDVWLGCGCNRCDRKINKMIALDGRRGVIPGLVSRIRQSGARVLYLGYLRSPGFDTPIENCKDEGDELEARLSRLAALDEGIIFHPITDLVPPGDLSFHAVDRIHPSLKGSAAIAERLARVIQSQSP